MTSPRPPYRDAIVLSPQIEDALAEHCEAYGLDLRAFVNRAVLHAIQCDSARKIWAKTYLTRRDGGIAPCGATPCACASGRTHTD